MDDPDGEICCNVEKWCHLVSCLTSDQKLKLASTSLRCMTQIPPIKMRTVLLKYMLEVFDKTSQKFIIQNSVGEISVTPVDVECILGLENKGLSGYDIIEEEGEDVKARIPRHFLSKTTGNIVVDELVAYIVTKKEADDDFLRMVILVLIGTVLAPMGTKVIPKVYYALVEDVDRISDINWNAFTLSTLKIHITLVKTGGHIRQWPKGNLAIPQVLFVFSSNNFPVLYLYFFAV